MKHRRVAASEMTTANDILRVSNVLGASLMRTSGLAPTLRGGLERLSDDPDQLVRQAVEALFSAAVRAAQVIQGGITNADTAAGVALRAGASASRRLKKAGHLYQEAKR